MFRRYIVVIFCLGWLTVHAHAEEPTKYKPIDPGTVAAYE